MIVWKCIAAVAKGVNGGRSQGVTRCRWYETVVLVFNMFDVCHQLSSRDGVMFIVVCASELLSDPGDGVDGMVVYSYELGFAL